VFEILLYQTAQGELPFRAWRDSLDPPARAKVQAAIERMAAGSLGDATSVGAGVLERRID
jgi:putative component of toxin-antitoxin plasmid stabilization module